MVFEKLGSTLKDVFQKITTSLFIDEKVINEVMKDIQRALLQADVQVALVFALSKTIKQRALEEKVPKGMTQREHLIKIIYEELVNFLGGPGEKISITKRPFYLMLVGLFGNGKTTTAGKLAKLYKTRGYRVAVVQTDTWRPAAYEQLEQLAKGAHADFYGTKGEKDAERIFAQAKPRLKDYDLVIVDTAGRDAMSDELIAELDAIYGAVHPDEVLLVLGAELGQSAEKQARTFHEHAHVSGVAITRLDGTAKGGGAISACAVTGAPVKFIGTGEKIDDIEAFIPERFVSRLLGMGDIETLLEKARTVLDEKKTEDLSKRFMKGQFNLIDLYEQMQAVRKMGPLSKVFEMIPGMGGMKIPKDALRMQEGKLERWRHIMDSCTRKELEEPDTIGQNRVMRIAAGSGSTAAEVRELLKQYKQSKKMYKMMQGGDQKKMEQLMRRMGPQMKF